MILLTLLFVSRFSSMLLIQLWPAEELYRVTKPSGKLILSTPFIFGIHEAPYDYFRFTKFGLIHLFNNFNDLEVTHVLVSFSLFTYYFYVLLLKKVYSLNHFPSFFSFQFFLLTFFPSYRSFLT